ncbi:MAG: hypothetical protein KTR16_01610 [Acidiferrobacterales bacterium]|nr:hypothetical protein [Acidiferrobacterales bacterium]
MQVAPPLHLKVGSAGFVLVSQRDDSAMDRTGWESVAVLVLAVTRAAWRLSA